MSVIKHPQFPVLVAIASCLLIQFLFAIAVIGPAWLNPVLSLPSLALTTWLWRRAERENETKRAFTELVI